MSLDRVATLTEQDARDLAEAFELLDGIQDRRERMARVEVTDVSIEIEAVLLPPRLEVGYVIAEGAKVSVLFDPWNIRPLSREQCEAIARSHSRARELARNFEAAQQRSGIFPPKVHRYDE